MFVDGHDAIIKSATHQSVTQLIEKYERPNEFAIAMLAGKLNMMNNGNSISHCTFFLEKSINPLVLIFLDEQHKNKKIYKKEVNEL